MAKHSVYDRGVGRETASHEGTLNNSDTVFTCTTLQVGKSRDRLLVSPGFSVASDSSMCPGVD
jgi:hypothetical protein